MIDPIIGYRFFVDRTRRPIFEQLDGRQFVLDDAGDRVYGVWIIPKDEFDLPIIVDAACPPR
jgi:hypothetical protein